MPPKRKLKRDISGLKNQLKLTTNSSRTNEPMSCGPDTVAPPAVSPDLRIDNGADVEEWMPNLPFDSNKPMWNDEECIFLSKFHCELNPMIWQ